ncbi:MAG: hypothetical protein NC078_05030 [Ruminococcus sp.]|nr:hypothetical protein [Ruminococcus sp.]
MRTYNETLYHHGIKGQKWGVRRYQNPDGSLTPAGEKRVQCREMMGKAFTPSIKNGKDKDLISPAEKILKESNNVIDNSSRLVDSISNIKSREQSDKSGVSSMTDEELRSAIARMNLERQYKSLSSEGVAKGKDYVKDTLSIVGSTVGITASVVGIIATIKKLKGG